MHIFMYIIFVVNLVYTKLSVRISSVFYHTFHTYFFLYICPRNRALWWIMSRSYKSTAWLTWCDVTPGPERSDRYRKIRSRPVDQETVKVRQQMFSHVYTMKLCTCLLFFSYFCSLFVFARERISSEITNIRWRSGWDNSIVG